MSLYGLAAGAALAAGASSAHATLITLDLTGLSASSRTTPYGGSLYFDVNAATAAAAVSTSPFAGADFRAINSHQSIGYGPKSTARLNNNGIAQNGIVGSFRTADRFRSSQFVGPLNIFGASLTLGYRGAGSRGNFHPGDTGFVGLRFVIGSDIHYGWANLSVLGGYLVELNELGYESNPNTVAHVGSAAGVPDHGSTLILLAMGATGVIAFRARQGKAV